MFLHASNKQFIEFIKSSKLEYCLDCVTVYHKNMKNISENNMYYLFDLAPASLDCFPFFSLSIIETKIILIQNLKCGHLCFIWSLVAVRIPWGPRVELIRQPVEFFRVCLSTCYRTWCYATCCPSLLCVRIRTQSHSYSSCVPTFNPNPNTNTETRPSPRLGPLSSATHNSDRSGENLRLITRPSVC